MTSSLDPTQSPAWGDVEYYLNSRQAAIFRISRRQGREITYRVDGGAPTIELIVELDRNEACPDSPSPALEIVEVLYQERRAARIRSNIPELMVDFHELITALAARMIRHGYRLNEALIETIRAWRQLIDAYKMRLAGRLGLHGEIFVLDAASKSFGWKAAVSAWVGPNGSTHDFSFTDFDMEVKTTSSERRRHRIHGLDQLTPKPGRPLWLVSIQAVNGGTTGRTLWESAETCLAGARTESVIVENELRELLARAGLSEYDTEAKSERWLLRTPAMPLPSSLVPRIDGSMIPPEFYEKISTVSYDVDLTGLDSPASTPLSVSQSEFP